MEIAFISLVEDIGHTALRYLSSYVRAEGYETKLIFLPRRYSEGWGENESYKYPYSKRNLEAMVELCCRSDIIGLSLMSCHFDNAVYITKFLREKLGQPIIWGGVHPTIRPLESLEYADAVCVGEGELGVIELLKQLKNGSVIDEISIPGILTKANHYVSACPKVHNLDDLGYPDYDLDHQFVLYKGNIIKLTNEIIADYLDYNYRTSVSRGCLHDCTYCCNNVFKRLDGDRNSPIRWRSVDAQIEELRKAKRLINGLSQIDFADDTFLARPYKQIEDFAAGYKEEIGLMFRILTSPATVTYEKIKVLADAGLNHIAVGVQSAYEPARQLYKRKESLEQIRNVERIIKRVSEETKKTITIRYDFIVDNPWGGEKDVEESIRFALLFEKPFVLSIFSLVFYPGTELYDKAKKEGIIKDDLNEACRVTQLIPKCTYMNELFLLMGQGAPKWLVRVLLNKKRCPLKFVRFLRNAFGFFVNYPRVIRFFLFERFRHNKRQVLHRMWQKVIKDYRAKRMLRQIPQFRGKAGEILAENFSESVRYRKEG